jgi:hypothetical protein
MIIEAIQTKPSSYRELVLNNLLNLSSHIDPDSVPLLQTELEHSRTSQLTRFKIQFDAQPLIPIFQSIAQYFSNHVSIDSLYSRTTDSTEDRFEYIRAD